MNFKGLVSLFCVLALAAPAAAQISAPGYVYTTVVLGDASQSCVASGAGGWFAGVGSFGGGTESIVHVTEGGVQRTVATGLNSIGDCAYDYVSDTLYVSDNALEAGGATTGDTVFAFSSASTATGLTASGNELVPAGSVPGAASVALDSAGDVYVSDAAGAGAGSVQKISGGSISPFIASGFDFTAGIAFEGTDLLVAESRDAFDNQVSRFDATGTPLGVFAGPSFAFGSFDLAINTDGGLLVTGAFGGDVVSLDTSTGASTSVVSGLSFATGIDVEAGTGRLNILSSTFSFPPVAEDVNIHQFTPMVAGGGSTASDCATVFTGVKLVPSKPGKPAKKAICVDGSSCDADGVANDVCAFPVGVCLNVDDSAQFPDCGPEDIDRFTLKKAKPASSAILTFAANLAGNYPVSGSACSTNEPIQVPVKVKSNGSKKAGKGSVKVQAERSAARPSKDTDTLKMVCEPAS